MKAGIGHRWFQAVVCTPWMSEPAGFGKGQQSIFVGTRCSCGCLPAVLRCLR
ncbi:msl2309 [Mesorhizobium japonicum MAFF 303099]|uniref:Msl2309 protein n=1 Tax=Mesorhizobium japonicum (strain LMG 29417 / CECT 9101 / MAFF 303099) TaxID=266835 RepID=Q98IP8_RHILO|nr:msl2309 [Mesorhizobium japonicum MAFF 303099]